MYVCLSVCSGGFGLNIYISIGRILIELGRYFENYVQWIISKLQIITRVLRRGQRHIKLFGDYTNNMMKLHCTIFNNDNDNDTFIVLNSHEEYMIWVHRAN